MSEQADDYCIVSHGNIKMLETEVKKLVGEGWSPHGSLTSVVGNAPNAIPMVCQAMVKLKKIKDEVPAVPAHPQLKHKHSLYKSLE